MVIAKLTRDYEEIVDMYVLLENAIICVSFNDELNDGLDHWRN